MALPCPPTSQPLAMAICLSGWYGAAGSSRHGLVQQAELGPTRLGPQPGRAESKRVEVDIPVGRRLPSSSQHCAGWNIESGCWRTAVDQLGRDERIATAHPCDQILEALAGYTAFGISASKVEQSFSVSSWQWHSGRLCANAAREERLLLWSPMI